MYGYDDGVDLLELFRLWRTDMTAEEVQTKLGISRSKLYSLVKRHKLPSRSLLKGDPTERQEKDPTEEEILARAAAVRRQWTEQEREKRRVVKTKTTAWTAPAYTYEPRNDRFIGRD